MLVNKAGYEKAVGRAGRYLHEDYSAERIRQITRDIIEAYEAAKSAEQPEGEHFVDVKTPKGRAYSMKVPEQPVELSDLDKAARKVDVFAVCTAVTALQAALCDDPPKGHFSLAQTPFTYVRSALDILLKALEEADAPKREIVCQCRSAKGRTWWHKCPVHGTTKSERIEGEES